MASFESEELSFDKEGGDHHSFSIYTSLFNKETIRSHMVAF